MCLEPKIFNGYETSCRECNECCATYKNTWVARCVAELQSNPHALAFTFTYADIDGVAPLGAKVFRYKDVQDFWKRLRRQGERKFGLGFQIRYVVIGEKGTRKGRCHYHGVMFSNHPIHELGKITSSKGPEFTFKKRLSWTTWGHGFVEFQRADRKGMSYALKYILKSRMTDAKSAGTHREGKTEYLAASYLWCSKVPAIGADWLRGKVLDGISKGRSLASLRVSVPGGGDWYISGEIQKDICCLLFDANKKRTELTGRPLAGFSTLVESVSKDIVLSHTGESVKRKSWEFLNYGQVEEYVETQEESAERTAKLADEVCASDREILARSEIARQARRAKRCFGIVACGACRGFRSTLEAIDDEQVELVWREAFQRSRDKFDPASVREKFSDWIARQGLVAYGCLEARGDPEGFARLSQAYRIACEELKRLQREAGQ